MEAHADGLGPADDERGSAVDLPDPPGDHCDPHGFMYEAAELVGAADEQMCEPGKDLSFSFAGVSKPVGRVVDPAGLVVDPFAELSEAGRNVAEAIGDGADTGEDVRGVVGDVRGVGEGVVVSDQLVRLSPDGLPGPDAPVTVLSRVHHVTGGTVSPCHGVHAVPALVVREATGSVAHPDGFLCEPSGTVDDAPGNTSGSLGTTFLGL